MNNIAVKLELERDILGRLIRRVFKFGNDTDIYQYYYDNYSDILQEICSDIHKQDKLLKETQRRNDVLMSEIEYKYEYDIHGNVASRLKEEKYRDNLTGTVILREYPFLYSNTYANNRLIESAEYFEGTKLNSNLYFYDDDNNKIIRIERYGRYLHQVEHIAFSDNIVQKSIYLSNGVLAYYDVMEIQNGKVASRRLLNPAAGNYYWYISYFDDTSCGIYISADALCSSILYEILNYIAGIKTSSEDMSVVIYCSDTVDNPFDEKIREVEEFFGLKGLYTV